MSLSNANVIRQPAEWQLAYLDALIAAGDALPMPTSIIDRDGQTIDTSGKRWIFPTGANTNSVQWKVDSPLLQYSLMSFSVNRAIRISASAGADVARNMPSMLKHAPSYGQLASAPDLEAYRNVLARVMQELAEHLKRNQTYWRYWLPVAWFKWGASRTADLGFDRRFALRLESIRIPGGPKGAAVRSNDPLLGPFDHELERPLLQLALLGDESTEHSHLQQKLAIALTLAFGRNSLSLRMLLEEDFRPASDPVTHPDNTLSIPLIKKRNAPRASFQTFVVTPLLADLITKMIKSNQGIRPSKDGSQELRAANAVTAMKRPILMRSHANEVILETADHRFALCMTNGDFRKLLIDFVARHRIISPITGELLHITARRMRYTFATDMVDMGLSKAELADALGHNDTQNVRVYYDIGARIAPHLEKAASGRIEPVLEMFTPNRNPMHCPNNRSNQSTKPLCAPLSCYSCPAFKPYAEVDHAGILRLLEAAFPGQADTANDFNQATIQTVKDAVSRVIASATHKGDGHE